MTYALLLLAGLVFALQFCTNKHFQTYKPSGQTSSVLFTLGGKIAATVFFACCVAASRANFFGNVYTIIVGTVQAALNLIVMIFGIKALGIGSIGAYTVSMMIGGMAIPAVFGAIYFGVDFGATRIAAFVLIAAAVVITSTEKSKKNSLRAMILYAILFLGNGFIGVFSDLHANRWGAGINGFTFTFTVSYVAAICYLPVLAAVYFIERKKGLISAPTNEFPNKRSKILYRLSPYATGILNGLGNLLIIICTAIPSVGSVVVFPLVTGGTILFTCILSRIFYREKITKKSAAGILLIVVALVVYVI